MSMRMSMSVRDRAPTEIIPPRYAMQEASNAARPLEVTKEALQTFFHTLDDDRDERITERDMQLFRQRNKLNLSPEVVSDIFTECKQRRFYNGQSPNHLTVEDIAAAISFRKLQNKSWQTRPFREQWIYMIKETWPAEKSIFAPRPAVMNNVAALSGKETGRQYAVTSPMNLFGASGLSQSGFVGSGSVSPIKTGRLRVSSKLHSKAGGQFARTPANLSATINKLSSGDLMTDSIDHQLAGSMTGDGFDARPHTSAGTGGPVDFTGQFAAGPNSYRPSTAPATVGFGFDVQRQYNDFNQSLSRDSELLDRRLQANRNSMSARQQGYYKNHLAKSLTGVRPNTSGSPRMRGGGSPSGSPSGGRQPYKTFFDKSTAYRFEVQDRQNRTSKIDVKPGMSCTDTSVQSRRIDQEKKVFTAKARVSGGVHRGKQFNNIGFNQMPDNVGVRIKIARHQEGFKGDSAYKKSLVPPQYHFKEYDNPEEQGKADFQGLFDKSWQQESWRKDVMVGQKQSKLDRGGGSDFILKAGCMDADTDGKGNDRHISLAKW